MKHYVLLLLVIIFISSCSLGNSGDTGSENINIQTTSPNESALGETFSTEETDMEEGNETIEPVENNESTNGDQQDQNTGEVSNGSQMLPQEDIDVSSVTDFGLGTPLQDLDIPEGKLVKIFGTLLEDDKELKDTEILYGYSSGESFSELGKIQSDSGGQYYLKFNLDDSIKKKEDLNYIDVSTKGVISRLFLVDSDFDVEEFLSKNKDMKELIYFIGVSEHEGEIIGGVDINL